jgi:predicted HTH transcriptional regulator
MSLEIIRRALEDRQFERLVGLDEDNWFEAKQSAGYKLDTPSGRYELAKDVCAFANSDGGFLLVGLNTDRLIEQNTDRVVSLDLCARANFDSSRYEGIIREYVHPEIANLQVRWIPAASQSDVGLGVIEIPPQESERKYFLTARVVEDAQTLRQIVFGLSRRNKSGNDPLSIKEVYEMMQKGKSTTSQQLGRIEEKVDALITRSAAAVPAESSSQQLDRRIEDLLTES